SHLEQSFLQVGSFRRTQSLYRDDPFLDGALQRCFEERHLVTVSNVHCTLGNSSRLRDRIDGGALESLVEKNIERGIEQFLVAERRPPARTPWRRRCACWVNTLVDAHRLISIPNLPVSSIPAFSFSAKDLASLGNSGLLIASHIGASAPLP